MFFLRCPSAPKMVKRDTGPFFVIVVAHSKAVPLCIKNEAEWHRAFFCHFCGGVPQLQKRCHAASKMMQRDTEGHVMGSPWGHRKSGSVSRGKPRHLTGSGRSGATGAASLLLEARATVDVLDGDCRT